MRLLLKVKILALYGTQANFARACGKSDCWVSRLVKGWHNPTPEEVELVISRLGMDHKDDLCMKQEIGNSQ